MMRGFWYVYVYKAMSGEVWSVLRSFLDDDDESLFFSNSLLRIDSELFCGRTRASSKSATRHVTRTSSIRISGANTTFVVERTSLSLSLFVEYWILKNQASSSWECDNEAEFRRAYYRESLVPMYVCSP